MQMNLTHLNANKFVQMAFVMFPPKMLFVIDLSTKMSGTSLFEKSLKEKEKKHSLGAN